MIIRPVEEKDLKDIIEIEEDNFLDCWTLKQYDYDLNANEFAFLFAVIHEGELIGYVDFWITFDQATINKIAIKKEYQKRGIGLILLEDTLSRIQSAEVNTITLEVRVSNFKAISLYQKVGFKTCVVKKNYYDDGEDAYYMIKELNQNG